MSYVEKILSVGHFDEEQWMYYLVMKKSPWDTFNNCSVMYGLFFLLVFFTGLRAKLFSSSWTRRNSPIVIHSTVFPYWGREKGYTVSHVHVYYNPAQNLHTDLVYLAETAEANNSLGWTLEWTPECINYGNIWQGKEHRKQFF